MTESDQGNKFEQSYSLVKKCEMDLPNLCSERFPHFSGEAFLVAYIILTSYSNQNTIHGYDNCICWLIQYKVILLEYNQQHLDLFQAVVHVHGHVHGVVGGVVVHQGRSTLIHVDRNKLTTQVYHFTLIHSTLW